MSLSRVNSNSEQRATRICRLFIILRCLRNPVSQFDLTFDIFNMYFYYYYAFIYLRSFFFFSCFSIVLQGLTEYKSL